MASKEHICQALERAICSLQEVQSRILKSPSNEGELPLADIRVGLAPLLRLIGEEESQCAGEPSMSMPIENLDLGARAYNILWSAGMRTVGDIFACGKPRLRNLRAMGDAPYQEIIVKLKAAGFNCSDLQD